MERAALCTEAQQQQLDWHSKRITETDQTYLTKGGDERERLCLAVQIRTAHPLQQTTAAGRRYTSE